MKQYTSGSVPSGTGHAPTRPLGTAPQARTSFSTVDFAHRATSAEPSLLEDNPSLGIFGATYQYIVDLPSTPEVTRNPVFVPHGDPIPAPDPTTGLRHYASRDYADTEDGTTVMVTHDPVTGEWHERAPDSRVTRGPALHWMAPTMTWRSGSPDSSSSSSSPGVSHSDSGSSLSHSTSSSSIPRTMSHVNLSSVTRIDPVWSLAPYKLVAGGAPTLSTAPTGFKSLMIGREQFFVDIHFGDLSGTVPHAKPDLYSVDMSGKRIRVGRVEPNGLYQVNGLRHYLPLGSDFYAVAFDSAGKQWSITCPQGTVLPDIRIEMGSAPDKWVPTLAVDNVLDLFQSSRQNRGYTSLVGPVDLAGNSHDRQVYSYMQNYLRQIIGFCDPFIRRAPMAMKGDMIDAYIWTNGYPYDCLTAIHAALARGQPLPPGMPVFDALEGLGTVKCSKNGNFSVARISSQRQLCYPDRTRSAAENDLLVEWKKCRDAKDGKAQGERNEQMYEARLTEDGYTLLPGGTYGAGQNGFDRVFEGPTGNIYLLEVKHVSKKPSGELGNASLGSMTDARQMTDKWVRRVLGFSDPTSAASTAVSKALARGQLFKLLGTTTEDGQLILFKIDMSLVDF